jgi:glucosamine--fructose-6-phosphate aminotransferase (isomerizing)
MCGVIGINSQRYASERLLQSLERLEYRGYDSAGISFLFDKKLKTLKAEGKVEDLKKLVLGQKDDGVIGIAHTRWATHGKPCEENAHPHSNGEISIIHNGIIENYKEIKTILIAKGASFYSETDSEVILQLLHLYLKFGTSPLEAVQQTIKQLKGAFAIIAIFANHPNLMIATRRHSPVAVGMGKGESFVGSDAYAISPFVDYVTYLEDDDIALCELDKITIFGEDGLEVNRKQVAVNKETGLYDKGSFKYYMQKEIFEQPLSSRETLNKYIKDSQVALNLGPIASKDITKIYIIACGTSLFAGQLAKYWLQDMAKIEVEVEIASEFKHRELEPSPGSVGIFISQSGETADTISALRFFKGTDRFTIGIVNNEQSTIARETDLCLPIHAGQEIGVASTKAFTSQIIVLAILTLKFAQERNSLSSESVQIYIEKLLEVPGRVSAILNYDKEFQNLSRLIAPSTSLLYIGRGSSYPIAEEGALKIKELSYIHAEAIAGGELKHGSIALVDEKLFVIAIAPYDKLFSKTMSNIQSVAARGGKIILLSNSTGCNSAKDICTNTITINQEEDEYSSFIAPLLYVIPLQLLAYHTAIIRGNNVDQPRNLAKSVTVE